MSQAGILTTTAGPVPPTVPTSFVEDTGVAVPAANILNVLGNDSRENDNDGINTVGSGNTVTIQLTNRLQGSSATTGATTTSIITFTPTVVGTYVMEVKIAAYNTTSTLGAGYNIFGTIRFDGANSNLCGTLDKITNEEGTMSGANVTMTVSGANVLFNGVGYQLLGVDQAINWGAVGLYTFVGV